MVGEYSTMKCREGTKGGRKEERGGSRTRGARLEFAVRPLLVRAAVLAIVALPGVHRVAMAQTKEVFGWVERVQIREADMPMLAKLDTGADTSSIHARQVREFDKNGSPWVQFEIRNFQGKTSEIKAPVVRVTKIKRHSGVAQRRIVIKLGLCLGEMFQEEYVSLVDRSNFDYQFLLGRSFLAGNAIIDPSAMYTSSPNCPAVTKSTRVTEGAAATPGASVGPEKATSGATVPNPKDD